MRLACELAIVLTVVSLTTGQYGPIKGPATRRTTTPFPPGFQSDNEIYNGPSAGSPDNTLGSQSFTYQDKTGSVSGSSSSASSNKPGVSFSSSSSSFPGTSFSTSGSAPAVSPGSGGSSYGSLPSANQRPSVGAVSTIDNPWLSGIVAQNTGNRPSGSSGCSGGGYGGGCSLPSSPSSPSFQQTSPTVTCSSPGFACVPKSQCSGGQTSSPGSGLKHCDLNTEVCCRQSHGQPGQPGVLGHGSSYPGQPGQPGLPGQGGSYPGQPGQSGLPGQGGYYPGQPGQPGQPGLPGQGGSYPGQPGQSGLPGQGGYYSGQPGQPGLPGQGGSYPGQPGRPKLPGQEGSYPGQPGQPGLSGQGGSYPGQPGQPGQPGIPGQGGSYPGQPGQPGRPGSPGHGSSYPGQPGQPGLPGQGGSYPGQPGKPGLPEQGESYPGQPGRPGSPGLGGSYPGQPGQPGRPGSPGQGGSYPGQPGQPGQPGLPGQGGFYPGQPGKPGLPGQGGSYPGQPGRPGSPGQGGSYPGQPGQPGQQGLPGQGGSYPGQPGRPVLPGQGGSYPGQPGQPGRPGQGTYYPGQPGTGGVPIGGSIYDTRPVSQPPSNYVTEAPIGPYTGPLNTTPHVGCPAALKCVEEVYCTWDGIMSDTPVTLTREQAENKVPLSECQNIETGIIGKCCRDPNYEDPWPSDMTHGGGHGHDDGQYHGPEADHGHGAHTGAGAHLQPQGIGFDSCGSFATCTTENECTGERQTQPGKQCRVPADGSTGVCCKKLQSPTGSSNLQTLPTTSHRPSPGHQYYSPKPQGSKNPFLPENFGKLSTPKPSYSASAYSPSQPNAIFGEGKKDSGYFPNNKPSPNTLLLEENQNSQNSLSRPSTPSIGTVQTGHLGKGQLTQGQKKPSGSIYISSTPSTFISVEGNSALTPVTESSIGVSDQYLSSISLSTPGQILGHFPLGQQGQLGQSGTRDRGSFLQSTTSRPGSAYSTTGQLGFSSTVTKGSFQAVTPGYDFNSITGVPGYSNHPGQSKLSGPQSTFARPDKSGQLGVSGFSSAKTSQPERSTFGQSTPGRESSTFSSVTLTPSFGQSIPGQQKRPGNFNQPGISGTFGQSEIPKQSGQTVQPSGFGHSSQPGGFGEPKQPGKSNILGIPSQSSRPSFGFSGTFKQPGYQSSSASTGPTDHSDQLGSPGTSSFQPGHVNVPIQASYPKPISSSSNVKGAPGFQPTFPKPGSEKYLPPSGGAPESLGSPGQTGTAGIFKKPNQFEVNETSGQSGQPGYSNRFTPVTSGSVFSHTTPIPAFGQSTSGQFSRPSQPNQISPSGVPSQSVQPERFGQTGVSGDFNRPGLSGQFGTAQPEYQSTPKAPGIFGSFDKTTSGKGSSAFSYTSSTPAFGQSSLGQSHYPSTSGQTAQTGISGPFRRPSQTGDFTVQSDNQDKLKVDGYSSKANPVTGSSRFSHTTPSSILGQSVTRHNEISENTKNLGQSSHSFISGRPSFTGQLTSTSKPSFGQYLPVTKAKVGQTDYPSFSSASGYTGQSNTQNRDSSLILHTTSTPAFGYSASTQSTSSVSPGHLNIPGQPGQSGHLNIPSQPGQSGHLNIPGQPGQPGHLNIPGQPGQSGHLNIPGQPGQSGHLNIPGQPGQPGHLNIPGQPGQSGHLNIPGQPGQSGHLNIPGQPGQPGNLNILGQPGQSGHLNIPGKLGQPGNLNIPGQPGYLSRFRQSGRPDIPKFQGRPDYFTSSTPQGGSSILSQTTPSPAFDRKVQTSHLPGISPGSQSTVRPETGQYTPTHFASPIGPTGSFGQLEQSGVLNIANEQGKQKFPPSQNPFVQNTQNFQQTTGKPTLSFSNKYLPSKPSTISGQQLIPQSPQKTPSGLFPPAQENVIPIGGKVSSPLPSFGQSPISSSTPSSLSTTISSISTYASSPQPYDRITPDSGYSTTITPNGGRAPAFGSNAGIYSTPGSPGASPKGPPAGYPFLDLTTLSPTGGRLKPLPSSVSYEPGKDCGVRRQVSRPNGPDGLEAGFGEFPWQAQVILSSDQNPICSGAILSDRVVVTSAHCLNELRSDDLMVKAGDWKLGSENPSEEPKPTQIRQVAAVARHPNYDPVSRFNDVAVLILSEPLNLDSNIDVLCLGDVNAQGQKPKGNTCVVTGWGKENLQGKTGGVLHSIPVNFIENEQCENAFRETFLGKYFQLHKSFTCILPVKSNQDLCQVDTGSPIACQKPDGRYELTGIYSWDVGCHPDSNIPAASANVDKKWVDSVMRKPVDQVRKEEEDERERTENLGFNPNESDLTKPGFSQGYGK